MMTYDVILRKKDDRYIARVRDWPELIVEEDTREAAIIQMKTELVEYLNQPPEIVQIDLEPEASVNPWLKFAGMWANDSTWDDFLAEVDTYRREIDEAGLEA
jgi:predicted RNase H-like HicB family nuclease